MKTSSTGALSLERYRLENALTISDLARKIGLPRTTVASYLSGARQPVGHWAFVIEDMTGINARSWYFGV